MTTLRATTPEDATAGAIVGQGFALYLVVIGITSSPTEAQWAEADPILRILPRTISIWIVPVLSVSFAWLSWRVVKSSPRALRRAAVHGALGFLFGLAAVGALRLAVGPTLPPFIPTEESARPGFQLSMTAGYAEEVIFRFALLPALFFGLRRHMREYAAAIVAALATGLAFALLHEAGADTFEMRYFVTRTIIPGAVMSLGYLYVSPAFAIVGHSSAHLLIPAMFD